MRGIRGTEVRNFIKANGEEGVIKCIEQMYERQAAIEAQQREVGEHLLNMTRVIDQLTSAGGALREQIERMQGSSDDEDLPPATG